MQKCGDGKGQDHTCTVVEKIRMRNLVSQIRELSRSNTTYQLEIPDIHSKT